MRKRYKESQRRNILSYTFFFNRLKTLAKSVFIWDTTDFPLLESTKIEEFLFNYDRIAIFENDGGVMSMLPYSSYSILNAYGLPERLRIYSPFMGFSTDRTYDQVALLEDLNNDTGLSMCEICEYFATKLYAIDRAIDVNLNNQKTPLFITAKDEATKLALKNMFMRIEGFENAIAVNDSFDPTSIIVYPINAPYLSDKLNEMKREIWVDALTCLGIPSQNDKRERMLVDEVVQNLGEHVFNVYTRLLTRLETVDHAKHVFGSKVENLTVRYNDKILENVGFLDLFDRKGGVQVGYSDTTDNRRDGEQ